MALDKLSHEVAVGALMMADSGLPAEAKVHLGEQLLSQAPDLASVHLVVGRSLMELGRTSDALAAFQRGLACAAEPDVKTRLLAELTVATEDLPKRAALLQEAAELNGNLIAAAQARVILKTLL